MKTFALLTCGLVCASGFARMDVQIAGLHVDRFHYDAFYNPFTHTYLFPRLDCDGAHRRIILSNDRAAIRVNEGGSSLGSIPYGVFEARTGLGIQLGMSRREVLGRLGVPSQSLYSKKFQAEELIYQRYTAEDHRGWYGRYANFYLFRGDRLFYIEVSYDLIGGGCGTKRGAY